MSYFLKSQIFTYIFSPLYVVKHVLVDSLTCLTSLCLYRTHVVKAEWCIEGTTFTEPVDLAQAQFSADGSRVEFDTTVTYTTAGTYFPTVRVYSERNGDAETTYTRIANLGKVRVVVK